MSSQVASLVAWVLVMAPFVSCLAGFMAGRK